MPSVPSSFHSDIEELVVLDKFFLTFTALFRVSVEVFDDGGGFDLGLPAALPRELYFPWGGDITRPTSRLRGGSWRRLGREVHVISDGRRLIQSHILACYLELGLLKCLLFSGRLKAQTDAL